MVIFSEGSDPDGQGGECSAEREHLPECHVDSPKHRDLSCRCWCHR